MHAENDERSHDAIERMVRTQIERRGIRDERVLAAFRRVPRARFVPPAWVAQAYADEPLPIGENQTISQPYIVALMTSLLDLTGGEKVLEIGTGSGYQTAILAELAAHVYTVEIVRSLSERARMTLESLGYTNICYRVGDGTEGWPEAAPFDRIVLTAAPRRLPDAIREQVVVGGLIVAPIGGYLQELRRYRRGPKGFREERHGGVRFVPMTGRALDD